MTPYLSRLVDSPDFGRLAALKPAALCPYLYYTIAPYIYTMANSGWFSWVKRTRRSTDRTPAVIRNPALKKINRMFVNEVLVRCPNPVNAVIAGIGPWENNTVAVRILHGSEDCPYHHLPDQQTILENDIGRQSLQYSRLFPETLLQAMAATPLKNAVELFDQGRAGSITPAEIISPCRFHPRENLFDSRRLLPGNCCPHVFQHIYPDALAAMVDADTDPLLSIRHPGRNNGEKGGDMTVKIKKTSAWQNRPFRRLIDGLYALSRLLGHPQERLDYKLEIKIAATEAIGDCPMRTGTVCAVNLRSPDFLCPASFHAVYPYLLLAAAGEKMNWGGGPEGNLIPCPDCAGVIYSIFRNHPDPGN
jgi:uncharacterized repeat protein (TIGR04076 family)